MKRLILLIVVIISFTLTGCMKPYTATDQQSDAIAEYMAGLILKSDKNYDQALIPEDALTSDTSSTVDTTDNTDITDPGDTPASDNATEVQNDYTLTQVIGESGFGIAYKGYKLVDTYPEDSESSHFSLTPREGYQLLVTSFTVKNKKDAKKEINLINSGVTYQLDVNTDKVYKPLLTLLENDLQYIDLSIAAGKSEVVLLVFEVSKDAEITDISLIATKGQKSVTIKLK